MTSIPVERDLVLLFTALNAACDAEVVRRIAAAGFSDLRPAHGYVFQHLIPGPQRITDLARRLGMTAQGASKLVIELEERGYVARSPDPQAARNRLVSLTERGWAGIAAGREARAAITRSCARPSTQRLPTISRPRCNAWRSRPAGCGSCWRGGCGPGGRSGSDTDSATILLVRHRATSGSGWRRRRVRAGR